MLSLLKTRGDSVEVFSSIQCLRSPANQMRSAFSASFHPQKSAKDQTRFAPLVSRSMKSRTTQAKAKGSFHPSGSMSAERRSVSRSQWVVGASRRLKSQSARAAEYGGDLSLRCYAANLGSKYESPSLRSKVGSFALMPNPSIERTSPGKPGAASHLKR
jgi:hypothetical protein